MTPNISPSSPIDVNDFGLDASFMIEVHPMPPTFVGQSVALPTVQSGARPAGASHAALSEITPLPPFTPFRTG